MFMSGFSGSVKTQHVIKHGNSAIKKSFGKSIEFHLHLIDLDHEPNLTLVDQSV